MAVPKKKTSRTRRDKRRSHHALTPASLMECPNCHQPKMTHHACPNCGYYNGRSVFIPSES